MRVLFICLMFMGVQLQAESLHIQISGVEDQHLSNVQAYLPLFPFQTKALPSQARLRFLHQQSTIKIQQSLHPFGFYRATVKSSLVKEGDVWQASYAIDKGDEIRLAEVDIQLLGEGNVDLAYRRAINNSGLKVGTVLNHENYTKLKNTLSALASVASVANIL